MAHDSAMRIIVAPNAFKGSLTAVEAAAAMAEGARRAFPDAEVVSVPVADGGDGTVETLVAGIGGEIRTVQVRGPLGEPVLATYGVIEEGAVAVIEMARAAGLALVPPDRRDPRMTTTYGVGELLQHAYEGGARRFIVGIGGSATNDGGAGMSQALGYHLLDERGIELPPGGSALVRLARIHLGGVFSDWKQARVDVACDVTNPLTGPRGASAVYGPQKGATAAMVQELDAALGHFAEVIRRDLEVDVTNLPGAGAAGGLGAGLVAFVGGHLRPGAEMVMEAVGLDERLRGGNLVLTGEGRLDSQTARFGKAPAAVAQRARAAEIPVIAVGGAVAEEEELEDLFDGVMVTVTGPSSLEEAMVNAGELLTQATERVCRLLAVGGTTVALRGKS